MSNRRRFIFLSSAAASLPLASTLLTQTSLAHAAIPFSEAELVRQMTAKLTLELSDATTASTEVGYLNDLFFNWEAASIAASQADSILVFGSARSQACWLTGRHRLARASRQQCRA